MTAYYSELDQVVELIQQLEDGSWECLSFKTGETLIIKEADLSDTLPF